MKNPKVVFSSLIALVLIYLMFAVDWLFVIPVIFIIFWNQKQLFKKK